MSTFSFLRCVGLVLALLQIQPCLALDDVRLQLKWHHQFQFAGYYAAIEKGFYRNAGIQVSLLEGNSNLNSADVVAKGEAEFGVSSSDLLLARKQGKPVVSLAVIFQHSPLRLLSLPASGINKPADLIGKRLMLESHSEEVHAWLLKSGVPLSDVTLVPYVEDEALLSGHADVVSSYVTDEPFRYDMAGIAYHLISPRSVGVDFYGDNLFTTEQLIEKKPELVEAFRRASLEGWRYAMDHPDEMVDLIRSKYAPQRSREHLLYEHLQMLPLLRPDLVELGYQHIERWRHIAQIYSQLNMLPRDVSLDGFVYKGPVYWQERFLKPSLLAGTIALVLGSLLAVFIALNRRLKEQIFARDILAQDLQNNEKQCRLLLENAPFPVIIARLDDQRVHYLNRRAIDYLQVDMGTVIGSSIANFYAEPLYRERFLALLKKDGLVQDFETELVTAKGQHFHVLINSYISEMDGIPVSFSAFSDITLRKLAEGRVAQSESELRLLLEMAPVPIVITRQSDGVGLFANRVAINVMGLIPGQLLTESSVDYYVEPVDRQRLLERLHRDGFVSDFETRIKPKGRKPIWVLLTLGRTQYRGQNALMAIFTNIGERKEMERVLRESEERYRFLAENTADVVWQTDQKLAVLYINEADQRLRGVPREQVIGCPLPALFAADSILLVQTLFAEQLMSPGREAIRFEARQMSADGHEIWVEINANPVRNEHGEILSFNGVTRDISERRKNAEIMAQANIQLAEQLRQIQLLQEALQSQAIHDPLTGLHNRRYLEEVLDGELARARREGYAITFAMLDLDHFKNVNDTYGHQAGDEALRALASLLKEHSRASDILCRYGGEEFLLILPNLCLIDARHRAELWRQQFAETDIYFHPHHFRVTMSIGLAAFPCHGDNIGDLLRYSDRALYIAKEAGRNQVALYTEPDYSLAPTESCCKAHL